MKRYTPSDEQVKKKARWSLSMETTISADCLVNADINSF
jgi:hypothetical protein